MTLPLRRLRLDADTPVDRSLEWIVTNGLGGYASGPVHGGLTRRFHGALIASLPAPVGRVLCLNHLRIAVVDGNRTTVVDRERVDDLHGDDLASLAQFTLEGGLPIWRYALSNLTIERRVVMVYGQNTTHILLRLMDASRTVTLRLQPAIQVRPHEGHVTPIPPPARRMDVDGASVELEAFEGAPLIRWWINAERVVPHLDQSELFPVDYAVEAARGYDHSGSLWSPGWIDVELSPDQTASFTVSTETWETVRASRPVDALARELMRRETLLTAAGGPQDEMVAELTIAADQFIVSPVGRADEVARARAAGDEPRTVIAGYHWFTDWGRDTMISLEGLTLATGRTQEAGCILRTFSHYVRDGLIPNLFPEGERIGLYHTADATLWFFHAIHRYVAHTGDRATLTSLLPTLVDIAEHHVRGTRFGIGVDEADGLLRQGADGCQLTWMDAKVGDWVVTPRRGKAVEINALWYNAVRLLAKWLTESGRDADAREWTAIAARAAQSFNRRFWNSRTGHLFDVVDGDEGDDPACRPNQVFAISLDYPVLDPERWRPVLDVVSAQLLTPLGLRSLSRDHQAYCATYHGDLRARDAAYHQGTVWAWLIGPFVDAWLRVHPEEHQDARTFLLAFSKETAGAGIGSIGEIFDADLPHTPRGCIAQAWSVAEVLRACRLTSLPLQSPTGP